MTTLPPEPDRDLETFEREIDEYGDEIARIRRIGVLLGDPPLEYDLGGESGE